MSAETSWLRSRAEEIQQEQCVWTRDSDGEDMAKVRDMAIRLAREFAERALKNAIPYDTDHPNYSSEEYEDEIAAALAEADKP